MQMVPVTRLNEPNSMPKDLYYAVIDNGAKGCEIVRIGVSHYLVMGNALKKAIKGTPVDDVVYPRKACGSPHALNKSLMEDKALMTLCGMGVDDTHIHIKVDGTTYLRRNDDIEGLSEDLSFGYFTKEPSDIISSHATFRIDTEDNKTYYVIDRCLTKSEVDGYGYYNIDSNPKYYGDNANDTTKARKLYRITRTAIFTDSDGKEITTKTSQKLASHSKALELREGTHYASVRTIQQFREDTNVESTAREIAQELGIGFVRMEYTDEEPSDVYVDVDGELLNVVPLERCMRWQWGSTFAISDAFDTRETVTKHTGIDMHLFVQGNGYATLMEHPSKNHVNAEVGQVQSSHVIHAYGKTDSHYGIDGVMKVGENSASIKPLEKPGFVEITSQPVALKPIVLYDRPKAILKTTAENTDGQVSLVNRVLGYDMESGTYIANDAQYWNITGNVVFDFEEVDEEATDIGQFVGGTQREHGSKRNAYIDEPNTLGHFSTVSSQYEPVKLHGIIMSCWGRLKERDTAYKEYTVVFYDKEQKPDTSQQKVGGTIRTYGDSANRWFFTEAEGIQGKTLMTEHDGVTSDTVFGFCDFSMTSLCGKTKVLDMNYTEFNPTRPPYDTDAYTSQMMGGSLRIYGSGATQGVSSDNNTCVKNFTTKGLTSQLIRDELHNELDVIVGDPRLRIHRNPYTIYNVTFPDKEQIECAEQCIGGTLRTNDVNQKKNQCMLLKNMIS